jgi:hypothetical protein
LLSAAGLEQHPAGVEQALPVIGIELQGLVECAHRLLVLTALPGRDAQHVMTPGVLGVTLGVAGEQSCGFTILPRLEDGLGVLIGRRGGVTGGGTAVVRGG